MEIKHWFNDETIVNQIAIKKKESWEKYTEVKTHDLIGKQIWGSMDKQESPEKMGS